MSPSEPEFTDGRPDPIDRWSRRVIGHMACDLGAKALFPFGGPPWHPFIAGRNARAAPGKARWASSSMIKAGLMVSYRGARWR
jgi:epoxyqueuosine reductase